MARSWSGATPESRRSVPAPWTPTLENLDAEVRRILDEEEAAASQILSAHRRILESLATALMSQETLQGPDLERALSEVEAVPQGGQGGQGCSPPTQEKLRLELGGPGEGLRPPISRALGRRESSNRDRSPELR